ncbi:MAG: transglycosylase domain-containing protein, partial [Mogibacterium sp.]|nr:transglycosylase domain-containing protein [Mogibacterium sp.]
MRSDRDVRTETEREIDDFLSKFETPADELSADIGSYLKENDTSSKAMTSATFSWKKVDITEKSSEPDTLGDKKPVIVHKDAQNIDDIFDDIKDAEKQKEKDSRSNKPSPAAADTSAKNTKTPSKKGKSAKKSKSAKKNKTAKKGTSANKNKSSEKGSLGRYLFLKKNKNYDPQKGPTYKKDGKTIKNKKYKFSFLKLIRDFVILGLICVLSGGIYAFSIIATAPNYDYKDIYSQVATSSVVYNDKGKQIDNIFYTENRKVIKYEDMPEDLINSFVAIEDKTFWKHHGFNWTRMIGAVLSSLTGSGRISGTSTITQQLARNVYLADIKSVRSIRRKLLEMYYANRLEHFLSKEEIIEAYLNTIYLGHGCYGVNAAARTYFSKKVKDLDLVECASLAALPQSPDTYALLKLASEAQDVVDSEVVATEPDTVVTNDISRERRQLTLDLMLGQNLIDKEEYDKAYDLTLNEFIDPNLKSTSSIYSYFHEYLVDTIIADLMEQYDMDYDTAERTVYTKGLQIYSTVDTTAMKVIAKEFQDGSNFPYVSAPRDGDGNLLNSD